MRSQLYVCPTCKSTKRINAHETQTTATFQQELPEKVICGWRGCEDYAVKRNCIVKVGMHTGYIWKDKNSSLVVCGRHKDQYEERAEDFGPFDWVEV